VKVNVKPSFNLKILADPVKDVYNLGENIDLTAIISPTMSLNGFNFVWKKNGQITPGSTDMISVVTDVSLVDTAILTYSITATSANGCSRTAIKQLILLPPVVRVANAFTPNGDGTNDVFKLLVLSGIAKVEHMEIYNRWGQRVYESNEENASWDGKINGQEAPSDVYIFRIRWRDGSGALRKPEEGQVTLLR
jgi:gliding motility-associated-like protein